MAVASVKATRACRPTDRARGPAGDPKRRMDRSDVGHRAGLRAGQSRHPAGGAGHRLPAVLPAQSEALPGARGRLAGRPSSAVTGEDLDIRTDVRALPRVPQRRAGRRAGRHQEALARRSGHLCAGLLVLIRGRADRRTASSCATSPRIAQSRCTAPTSRPRAAGPFHGPLVVSMRPMKPADAIRAIQITTRFPAVHGAPVHIGKPELIGIKDHRRSPTTATP